VLRVEAERIVGRYDAHRVGWEARDLRGLGHRVVDLVGHVQDAVEEVLTEPGLASGYQRREGRHRPARCEQPLGVTREAEQVAQPPQHRLFELDQGRRGTGQAGVAVDDAGQEITEGRGVEAAPGDIRHEPRVRRVEP
jgi:hypothetical protein